MTGFAAAGFFAGGGLADPGLFVSPESWTSDLAGAGSGAEVSVYFRRIGLMRKSFWAVKLAGLIFSNSTRQLSQTVGSPRLNAVESIFLERRYASKSTALSY